MSLCDVIESSLRGGDAPMREGGWNVISLRASFNVNVVKQQLRVGSGEHWEEDCKQRREPLHGSDERESAVKELSQFHNTGISCISF